MTHTRQLSESEGTFNDETPDPDPCPKCGGHVLRRVWESSDGAYEDTKYRCVDCNYVWWIDGIDS